MEITNTLSSFARLADEGRLEELGNLFTADIEWSMPGAIWRGRAEVLSGLGSMRDLGHAGPDSGNRHVITNLEVYVDPDRATARSYFLLVSQGTPAAILAVGFCHDELLHEHGQWLIARREVTT
ncbi:nuclear transport factor 2 family protein [Streptomyces turgidiscabies]|uniref:SnoaL-like domain-containing protein n=1 Tax=Streptomyces turgidiscabies (strain Car8) TaxID=698760 RepID=L7FFS6_STRT8|nr:MULTISPECIES: nuclear transport factor 2 family protein [Streptomyces]ELP69530.1 hypothetical protein STRTUCAR8_00609 [Streptomyces turgidiscabies Car8]MDX3496140.1 nuclear transport factor 2 family protein [Streptomyces turgidiscabies]GAQ75364.1 ring hydroxylating beta subunit [Streptomyces turgidiscabies]